MPPQPKKGSLKGNRPGIGIFKTEKKRTTVGGLLEPYEYRTTSIDTSGYSKNKPTYKVVTTTGTNDKLGLNKITNKSVKTIARDKVLSTLKSLQKNKKGGTVKSKKK